MQHGIVKINLGGKERILKFNSYCLINIATILKCDPLKITEKLNVLVQNNIPRAINVLTWASIMGYKEEIAEYDDDVSIQEVAVWVQASDINEFMSVWDAFKDASGISDALAKIPNNKTSYEEKKKI